MRWTVYALLLIAIACGPASATASPVTVDFSGNVDLSALGGLLSNPFHGSFTWDSSAVAIVNGCSPDCALYEGIGGTLVWNGVDHSADVVSLYIFVANGTSHDGLGFSLGFVPGLASGPITNIPEIEIDLLGTTSLFGSTALPGNSGFLSSGSVTSSFSYFPFTGQTYGTATVTAVPEPAALTLTLLGIASALSTKRRHGSTTRLRSSID